MTMPNPTDTITASARTPEEKQRHLEAIVARLVLYIAAGKTNLMQQFLAPPDSIPPTSHQPEQTIGEDWLPPGMSPSWRLRLTSIGGDPKEIEVQSPARDAQWRTYIRSLTSPKPAAQSQTESPYGADVKAQAEGWERVCEVASECGCWEWRGHKLGTNSIEKACAFIRHLHASSLPEPSQQVREQPEQPAGDGLDALVKHAHGWLNDYGHGSARAACDCGACDLIRRLLPAIERLCRERDEATLAATPIYSRRLLEQENADLKAKLSAMEQGKVEGKVRMLTVDDLPEVLKPKRESSLPRRMQMLKWCPGEKAIWDAAQVVEEMGAHPKLTEAVTLLGKARDAVADYIDSDPAPLSPKPEEPEPDYEAAIAVMQESVRKGRTEVDKAQEEFGYDGLRFSDVRHGWHAGCMPIMKFLDKIGRAVPLESPKPEATKPQPQDAKAQARRALAGDPPPVDSPNPPFPSERLKEYTDALKPQPETIPWPEGKPDARQARIDWGCGSGRVYLSVDGSVVAVQGDPLRDMELQGRFKSQTWTPEAIKYVVGILSTKPAEPSSVKPKSGEGV